MKLAMHFAVMTATSLASLALAQTGSNETIWSSVVYSYHGERTPLILPMRKVLTPSGAQQVYSVGSFFRDRYVAPTTNESHLGIRDLSKDEVDSTQSSVMSTLDEYVVASAQAFMQGLYPPLNISSRTLLNPMSIFANGSIIDYPLGGYQYAQIYTASALDPNSIYIAGDVNCPAYDNATMAYVNSQESTQIRSATMDFYDNLGSGILAGVFEKSMVNYDEAYLLYDYLSYAHTHNQTVKRRLSEDDLARAKALANQWMYATNGRTSGSDSKNDIRTVTGRTMLARAIGMLINNVETEGSFSKLNMLFGSFEPMIAFAALAQLPQANTNFYGIPNYGSSMVFELFSVDSTTASAYPSISDLKIRFLFRNGTLSTSNLEVFNLFGRNDAQGSLSLNDFLALVRNITLPSVGDWCDTCQSQSVSIFCPAYSNSTSTGSVGLSPEQLSHKSCRSPVVSGAIGAIVALCVAGLVLALSMVFGRVRFYRGKPKRGSELGGFKGGEKLASDPDLPATSSIGVTVVGDGHSRVGSWELGAQNPPDKANAGDPAPPEHVMRPSFEADDLDISSSSHPTKIDERV